ncbi:BrnT family toxin [Phyllobacterium meliloti]|uniref:BrnT family toxin n=1 Tax=Phyllobacterium meliloti TaxID=555317 RepID=UPI001D13E39E|nr:BrnT family toxin [Phyllobacterium sp. T1293]UGX87611.1 BrnT family toxin [Phyllobacterium sp. T1293]
MKIVWDEPKRIANIEKHGLDFVDLPIEFFATSIPRPAKKGRLQTIGYMGDELISVIFVALGTEAISVISMRPAKRTERNLI